MRAGPETKERNREKVKLLAFECAKLTKIATMVNYILARGSPLMQGLLNQNKSDGYICLMHSGVKNKSLQSEQVTRYKKTKLRRLFVSWKSNKPYWVSSARLRKKAQNFDRFAKLCQKSATDSACTIQPSSQGFTGFCTPLRRKAENSLRACKIERN